MHITASDQLDDDAIVPLSFIIVEHVQEAPRQLKKSARGSREIKDRKGEREKERERVEHAKRNYEGVREGYSRVPSRKL